MIAATNRDLEAAVELGEFREDLLQRLSVAVLRIPPLRERAEDAVLLARDVHRRRRPALRRPGAHGLRPTPSGPCGSTGGQATCASSPTRSSASCSSATPIRSRLADLGLAPTPSTGGRVAVAPTGEVRIEFPEGGLSLEAVERAILVAGLEKAGGNQSAASRLLGVSRDTLRYRMEKYGL